MARRLGDILVAARLVSDDQLKQALAEQKRAGVRLGEALVRLGFVSEIDVARTLAEQLGLQFLPGAQIHVDERIARILPEAAARRYEALPIGEDGGRIVVAMLDPLNVFALDDIAFLAGREVKAVVVTREALARAMQRVYGGGAPEAAPARGAGRGGSGGAPAVPAADPWALRPAPAPARAVAPPADTAGVRGRLEPPGHAAAPARPGAAPAAARPGGAVSAPPAPASAAPADEAADEGSVVQMVAQFFDDAIDMGASDIHVEPQEDRVRVRFRVDGVLREIACVPPAVLPPLISRIKILASMDISEKRVPQDGRIQIRDGGRDVDLRVSTLPTVHGEKAVLRILDKARAITDLDRLGFMPDVLQRYREMIKSPYGMILVTGPTGSGKTSTLMATLTVLNAPDKNIVTIEDPVEYQIPGVNQVQVNVKAGLTFAAGLRAFLRQDPDIVMVGEIRDAETAEIAIRAALTGHLVFSTLHTNDAPGAVARLLDMDVEPYLVASSVLGAVAQRLARRLCPACREPYEVPPGAPERFILRLPEGTLHAYRGRGCPECHGTGYKGRLAIFELMAMTPELRGMVVARASADDLRRVAVERGMRTLADDGVAKALEGLTTLEEVQRVALFEG